MADFGFGLAKSAVQGTLTMVKSAIEEEKKLRKDVQRDLMLISDEFQMMHSVLNDYQDSVTDNVTKTSVRQVRDMALDVEDCIELGVHLNGKSTWWHRMLPSCVPAGAPAADLDAAVANIELLKARVEAMGHRNLRYSRISPKPGGEQMHQQPAVASAAASDSFMTLRYAAEKQSKHVNLVMLINRKGSAGAPVPPVSSKKRKIRKGARPLGEEQAEQGIEDVAVTAALQVISVLHLESRNDVGTMLIEKAYDDPETCRSFRCRAWVKLMHPFNPCEFIRSLLTQFYKNYHSQKEVDALDVILATDALLIEEFKKQINSHRYIVVLEDISTMADWKAVRVYLPDMNNGSCIVVHTQQLGIASLCVGHPHRVLDLENFSADHSVYALSKEEFEEHAKKAMTLPDTTTNETSSSSMGSTNRPPSTMSTPDAAGKVEVTRADKQRTAREWLDEHKLVGNKMNRMGFFVSGYQGDVVASVWGMPGVGKSFLVKRTYYSQLASGCATRYRYGWVDVSHPFNLMELSRSLLLDLDPVQHHKMLAIEDPILVCREYLHKHECYIVIDGLQSMEDWDMTKVALGLGTHKGNIFVITTEESVANYCRSGTGIVSNVKCLDVHQASELLEQKVQSLGSLWPEHPLGTEEKRRIIVHKCGGLPKVICAAVDMYRKYDRYRYVGAVWRENLVSMWEANARFMEESLQNLFAWLHSYFRKCPDSLKPWIFYLTIFPLNHTIRRRRLVRRWIAEGYAREDQESTSEENGEINFIKLLELSMIQVQPGWIQQPLCQVNGFFREYIISRSMSMEENLVFKLKGHCSKNLQRTGRHLAIEEDWDRDKNVFESIDFSRLRSLTVFGEWKRFFISEKMKLLRVLDLEDVSSSLGPTNGDVELMVKLLPRLKFLSLRRCRQITHLPDSLGDLKQLQTLDIRGTSVMKLPKSITKLERLQYISAGASVTQFLSRLPLAAAENPSTPTSSLPVSWLSKSCIHCCGLGDGSCQNYGIEVPRGIGRLSNMHTLGVVNISDAGVLEELKNLTQLHKLRVSGINRNNSSKLFSTISCLAHLRSLSLQVELDEDNQSDFLDGLSMESLRENLQSLKLYGPISKLPEWTKELHNVKKLSLHITTLTQDGFEILNDLQSLEILRLFLSEFQNDELQFGSQSDEFQSPCNFLKFLEISCNSRSPATITFPRRQPKLLVKVLRLRCWGVSSLQISGLHHLQWLEEVWLSGPWDDAHKQQFQSEVDKCSVRIRLGKPVLRLEEPGSWTPWLRSSW